MTSRPSPRTSPSPHTQTRHTQQWHPSLESTPSRSGTPRPPRKRDSRPRCSLSAYGFLGYDAQAWPRGGVRSRADRRSRRRRARADQAADGLGQRCVDCQNTADVVIDQRHACLRPPATVSPESPSTTNTQSSSWRGSGAGAR